MKQRNAERVISDALIALGFDEKIRDATASMGRCSLYSYTDGVGLPLKLEYGPDALASLLDGV